MNHQKSNEKPNSKQVEKEKKSNIKPQTTNKVNIEVNENEENSSLKPKVSQSTTNFHPKNNDYSVLSPTKVKQISKSPETKGTKPEEKKAPKELLRLTKKLAKEHKQPEIEKIQSFYKTKSLHHHIKQLRKKTNIIQRAMRNYLIKKYNLSSNYYYNELYFQFQDNLYANNLLENLRHIFPLYYQNLELNDNKLLEEQLASSPMKENNKLGTKSFTNLQKQEIAPKNQKVIDKYYGESYEMGSPNKKLINQISKSKLVVKNSSTSLLSPTFNKSQESLLPKVANSSVNVNSFLNLNPNNVINPIVNPIHNPYDEPRISMFEKILEFDLIINTDEVYDTTWGHSYEKHFAGNIMNNTPLQQIELGISHTISLNDKGKAYSFGWNNYGQCGVPLNSTIISKNEYDEEKTNKGELKLLNKIEGMKNVYLDDNLAIKQATCGEDHSLLLDTEGGVWGFGLNLNGQLGIGHMEPVNKPTKVVDLEKFNITKIVSGEDINFAVSEQGDCFMWPWCIGGNTLQPFPLMIPTFGKERIENISCGSHFAMFVGKSGLIFSMGKTNNFGQLGHGDTEPKLKPTKIDYFAENQERIVQVSCGYKHTVAKSITGQVFTWGLVNINI